MLEVGLPPHGTSGRNQAGGNPGGVTPYVYPCTSSTAHAFQKYYDPAGITVTSQTDVLTWFWNGTYICNAPYGNDSPYGAADGWYLDPGYTIQQGTSDDGYVDSYWTTNVHWVNEWFCANMGCSGPTYVTFPTTQIWGNQHGQINGTLQHSVSGGGYLLLHWYGDWCLGTGRC